MAEMNPYAPPRASLEGATETAAEITLFPRFSAWWVFLLAIVTLSVYIPYWLWSRSKILNRIMPSDGVAPTLIGLGIALYAASFLFAIAETAYPGNPGIKIASSLVSFASNITLLVWVFSLRNRLNRLLGASSGDERWLGGIMTFFFQILYLQYKINQAIDVETNHSC